MTDPETGVPTFHLRAESWECDFNGHWNTRYYCKAFQTASQVAAMLDGNTKRDSIIVPGRHLRFHSEVHGGDALTIRSFSVPDGPEGPATAHFMLRGPRVVATALDSALPINRSLTELTAEAAAQAMPRGVTGPVTSAWQPDAAQDLLYELGPVTADQLHGDGTMTFWESLARVSNATHHHDLTIGFTLERMRDEGIGRMLAELRYSRLAPCAPGDFLRAASHITSTRSKGFTAAHMLYTHRGTPVAMFELATLSVDMKTRRAMPLPEFVTARRA